MEHTEPKDNPGEPLTRVKFGNGVTGLVPTSKATQIRGLAEIIKETKE